MLKKVKGSSGFTFVEIMMVMIMLSVLFHLAWNFMGDMRKRSSDVSAVADGRNLMTAVRASFINLDDVSYDRDPGEGREIGTEDTLGNGRPAILTLSPGVRARIVGGSKSGKLGEGYLDATLFHIDGTPAPTPSGKREFWFFASELTGIFSLPTY
jgi:prepilin-type N-terminal cleavage/methylation domain-containing protein